MRALLALLCMLTLGPLVPARAAAQEPIILKRAHVDPDKPIDFHATVSPETLYVGQQAMYQFAVFLEEVAATRLRRNPEFLPPEFRGLIAYDVGTSTRYPGRETGGRRYAAIVFQKALFPLASGQLNVPSPQLTYSLPQSTSYFSREESHVVRAESTSLVVRPLPEEGRPADYLGAVGVLKSTVRLDATTARVGDPLVLTLRVYGTGNVKLFPRPTLEVEWASVVPSTERLQVDTSTAIVRGAKEFDWILTPTREGPVVTPAIRYSYFNPYTGKYEVAEAPPHDLTVQAGSLATVPTGEESTALSPLREHTVGTVATPVGERWQLWALFALLPLPALVLALGGAPRAAAKQSSIERLRGLLQTKSAERATRNAPPAAPVTARDVRRLLLVSLAERLGASPDVLNERTRTERLLRRRGVTRETTQDVLDELARLDVVAFAPSSHEARETSDAIVRDRAGMRDAADTGSAPDAVSQPAADAARAIENVPNERVEQVRLLTTGVLALYDRVNAEALAPARRGSSAAEKALRTGTAAAALCMLATFAAGSLVAQSSDAGWNAAVDAYRNRRFVDAAERFRQLALVASRDADVLTNWGTASWAAGDTVNAVIAWQRAARLDPLAADLREHLLQLPAGARDGVADIPLVPVSAFGYAGVALWAVGWMTVAWLLWRRRNRQPPQAALRLFAVCAMAIGAAGAGLSFWTARTLRADGLAVVVRPETMRAAPEGDADALGGAATGDIVRTLQQRELWSQVRHADGREGWLPADHLAPLANGALP